MDAIGYVRVSTDRQESEGDSLEVQTARLNTASAAAGDRMLDILVDGGRSAKNLKRKGLQSALARLRAGEAVVLWVTKIDRLTRRPADLELLLERHFGQAAPHVLRMANEPHDAKTAAGRLTLRILVDLAQYELDVDSERTRDVLDYKGATGRAIGPAPLGFTRVARPHQKPCICIACIAADGAPMLVDGAGQATLVRIRELDAAGDGPSAIARVLTEEGFETKRGGKWRACTVVKLLARAHLAR